MNNADHLYPKYIIWVYQKGITNKSDMFSRGILLCMFPTLGEDKASISTCEQRECVAREHYFLYIGQPGLLSSKSCSSTEALGRRPSLLNRTRCCSLSDIYLNFHLPGQLNDIE